MESKRGFDMDVLLTGAFGRVGTAIIEQLSDESEYNFTYLDRTDSPSHETYVADVANLDSDHPAFEDKDAVIHLAGYPETDGTWDQILESNIVGMHNTLNAAAEAGIESFIFASTNHVVGMYEVENAPEIYHPQFGLVVDHKSPIRPDSYYGTSKVFDEALGRYYVENFDYPMRFYALRIGSVRATEYDHPYGDAEKGVAEGEFDRGSREYDQLVARMKAMWQSRRDLAHQVECCLLDDDVEFGVFYGISDNDARWFDLEHARTVLGYCPRDNGANWTAPPDQ